MRDRFTGPFFDKSLKLVDGTMRKIYLLTPANTVTGGPELLHQLCHKLNLFGFNAHIVYVVTDEHQSKETPLPYRKYNISVCDSIDDNENNIVIFPEIYLFALNKIKKAQRIMWWLSVDNALGDKEDFEYLFSQKDIMHFSQSQYSTEYILSKGVERERIYWLSDYISSEFLHLKSIPAELKKNVVVYNPRKGFEKTEELIKQAGDRVKWIPLEGYSPEGVRNILQESKVYIDFGNHPGKDRIPREAAYCGCCLLTNQKGSAGNDVDIPIDTKYKIKHDTPAEDIIETILSFFDNYSSERVKLKSYIDRIENEYRSFETDVLSIFEKIDHSVVNIDEKNELRNQILTSVTNGDYSKALTCIVKYRQKEYEEDIDFSILESTARSELGELNEAEHIARKALISEESNYELMLLLAKIHLYMKDYESVTACLSECAKAVELAKNTEDAEIVVSLAKEYINKIKKILK